MTLNELESKMIDYGINVVPRMLVKGKKDIEEFVHKYGFPIVIKGYSKEHTHKTEHGLVHLNVCNINDALKVFNHLLPIAEKIYVEKQIRGREFYISIKRDILYGDVIGFGKGGIDINIDKDVSFRLLPLKDKEIFDLIASTHYGSNLIEKKFRDIPKFNEKSLFSLIENLYSLYKKEHFIELEINPLIINSEGYWVVDIRALKMKNKTTKFIY